MQGRSPDRIRRESGGDAYICVAALNWPSAEHDLSIYHAGAAGGPDLFHDARQRILCASVFVLGPMGAGFGWVEFAIGPWRGRRADDMLMAYFEAKFDEDPPGFTPAMKAGFLDFIRTHMGNTFGILCQPYRYLMGPVFDAHLDAGVRSPEPAP